VATQASHIISHLICSRLPLPADRYSRHPQALRVLEALSVRWDYKESPADAPLPARFLLLKFGRSDEFDGDIIIGNAPGPGPIPGAAEPSAAGGGRYIFDAISMFLLLKNKLSSSSDSDEATNEYLGVRASSAAPLAFSDLDGENNK
jgi:hypothetical protein